MRSLRNVYIHGESSLRACQLLEVGKKPAEESEKGPPVRWQPGAGVSNTRRLTELGQQVALPVEEDWDLVLQLGSRPGTGEMNPWGGGAAGGGGRQRSGARGGREKNTAVSVLCF